MIGPRPPPTIPITTTYAPSTSPVDEAWSVNLSSSTAKEALTIPRRPLDVVLRPHQLQLRQPLLSDRQPAPRRLRPLRQNNRWGTFPSANVMWRPTMRLSYVTHTPWLYDAKIRAGYGVLGNDGIAQFLYTRSYVGDQIMCTNFGGNNEVSGWAKLQSPESGHQMGGNTPA